MTSRPKGPFLLDVKFEHRDDGGLRAYCDNLPGFVLSHPNAEAVLADVEPALSTILSAMYGMPVIVERAEIVGLDGVCLPPAHVCDASYIGMSRAA